MKTSLILFFAFALTLLVNGAGSAEPAAPTNSAPAKLKVATLELHETTVVNIPTHPNVTVFIQFPYPITDYTGRGFSENPSEVAGDFFLRYLEGDCYLSVTPLTDAARRTLHVVCDGKEYPVHFFPADEDAAWEKVIFLGPDSLDPAGSRPRRASQVGTTAGPVSVGGTTRGPVPPRLARKDLSAERAVGMIDTLRLLANLPDRKAKEVIASNSALSFSLKRKRQNYGDYAITTHFVIRDDVYDALGFSVTIENASNKVLTFVPNSLTVRAGDHVYAALASDFDPVLKPRAKEPVFFVMAGDGTGRANHLSTENDFRLSIELAGRSNPAPTTTLDVPPPSSEKGGDHEE